VNLKLAVAITVNDRPEYLGQVIESWHQVRGIDDVPVLFQVEPASDECYDMCLKAGFAKQFVMLNKEQRGALGNPYYAIDSGFSVLGTEFVLLGEDDSTVTADVLEYVDYAATTYASNNRALAVCTFQYKPLLFSYFVHQRRYFASVVWGTWRDRWDQIRNIWPFDYNPAWDRMLLDMTVYDDRYCVFPGFSRSQHIGRHGGTHMNESDFETLQAKRVHDGSPQRYRATGGVHE
jgi:hypothetical protein